MNKRLREARADGALRYWRTHVGDTYPFLHPPDLFRIDPCAERPFIVPSSFIPEPLGGSIEVRERGPQGRRLGAEAADFIVGAFLPEGHKKRWEFAHFRASNEPSSMAPGTAAIDRLIGVNTPSEPLSDLPYDANTLPIAIDTEVARVYYPSSINVERIPEHARYQWSEALAHVSTSPIPGVASIRLRRDPLSTPLAVLLPVHREGDDQSYVGLDGDVLRSVMLLPDLVLSRCYFGNWLTLFADDGVLMRLVTFHHDADNAPAVLATRHRSEGIRIELECGHLLDRIPGALSTNPVLAADLAFGYIGREMTRGLLIGESFLSSVEEVRKLLVVLSALDARWRIEGQDGLGSFGSRKPDEIAAAVDSLIPETGDRLSSAGFTQTDRARWRGLFLEHTQDMSDLIARAFDPTHLVPFAEEVFTETLRRVVHLLAMQLVITGEDSLMVYLERPPGTGTITITLYDALQGGSGVSRTLYERIVKDRETIGETFSVLLRDALRCDVDLMGQVELSMLRGIPPHELFAQVQEGGEALDRVIRRHAASIPLASVDVPATEMNDLIAYVRRDLARFTTSEEMTAFARAVARLYGTVCNDIGRSPRATDLLVRYQGDMYNPRALALWQQYQSCEAAGRSELLSRLEELVPSCVGACPDCLDFEPFGTSSWDADWLLDRRVLLAVLEA